jgi:choline dehydrogenase-like flavoprotein
MFVDCRELPKGSQVSADLCIIGGGAAGITLALDFHERRYKVVLLESGGLERDDATQALYDGDSVGMPYDSLANCRSRYLGGSTNCWLGWCRPLDDIDFQRRHWIAGSGWPFSREELLPYYNRAQSQLQLSPFDYHPLTWQKRLGPRKASFLTFGSSDIDNVINQLSPPSRFGTRYRSTLATASNIQVFLHANATELETNPTGRAVEKVHVTSLTGSAFSVVPRMVVLATGGIENARLLLASRRVEPNGLGNGHDLVGRYFMDHPRVRSFRVKLSPDCDRRLYDHSLALVRQRLKIPHLPIAVHYAPTEGKQREMELCNSRTYLVASAFDRLSEASTLGKALMRSIRSGPRQSFFAETFRAIGQFARRAPGSALAVVDFALNPEFGQREFHLETAIEPIPQRDSRVTLGAEKDQLGMHKVRLDWRLSDMDKRNYLNSVGTICAEMERRGLIVRADPKQDPAAFWPSQVQWCWHHMGTTRMNPDPTKGVVDADCRVHGVYNLFIAGSSVFPTAGSDTPTLTIVALALRLGRRLEALLSLGARATRSTQTSVQSIER